MCCRIELLILCARAAVWSLSTPWPLLSSLPLGEAVEGVVGEAVEPLHHSGHDGRGRHVDEVLHVLYRLLLAQVQPELVLNTQQQ